MTMKSKTSADYAFVLDQKSSVSDIDMNGRNSTYFELENKDEIKFDKLKLPNTSRTNKK